MNRDLDMSVQKPPLRVGKTGMGFREFIVFAASIFALTALSIDIMLPVLPEIGKSLGLQRDNDQQLVILVFALGFGISQVVFGPLADRYGRRALMVPSLIFYVLTSAVAVFAPGFGGFLLLRLAQGIACAAIRTVLTAVVRDCFKGREMARVMSFVFTVFLVVPVFAPAIGQLISALSGWRNIFLFLALAGLVLCIWSASRLGETQNPQDRIRMSIGSVAHAFAIVFSNRQTIGYTLAVTFFFGGLFAFIVSVQQVFDAIYGLGNWFAIAFGVCSIGTATASLINGALVRRIGMRLISHLSLLIYIGFGVAFWLTGLAGEPPFAVTYIFLCGLMVMFGFIVANFNAMAMEPMGHVAGTASAVIGMITTTGGTVLGGLVGLAFDGTVMPLATAFTVYGSCALIVVLWTERGRLFATSDAKNSTA